MSHSCADRPLVERLESRQLLSAMPVAASPWEPLVAPVATLARAFNPASVVGGYAGTVTVKGYGSMPAKLAITTYAKGLIKGKLIMPSVGSQGFVVRGSINSRGNFAVKFNQYGIAGTISGVYNQTKKTLSGTFHASSGYQDMTGTFLFKKRS